MNAVSPFSWLGRQSGPVRLYWQSRDKSLEIAGVGVAHGIVSGQGMSLARALDAIHRNLDRGNESLRYYGGIAFDPMRPPGVAWEHLGAFRFVLPRFEVVRRADQVMFAAHLYGEDNHDLELELRRLEAEYEALCFDELKSDPTAPFSADGSLAQRPTAEPDRDRWCKQVRQVLSGLGPDLNKLVLACKRSLQLTQDVDAAALLQHIRTRSSEAYHFLFQSGQSAFLGSSPECLYRREGRQVCTEAVAGTYRCKGDGASESAARQVLLNCPKEMAEHDYVVTDVQSALKKICTHVEVTPAKEVVPWNRLYHLRTRFSGTLAEVHSDHAIIEALHPSAAVLGYPRPEAWEMLAGVERFGRGWYAGPVGWIGREAADFAVAIRSALLRGRSLDVYAGAGIVAGSEPGQEWDEVRSKMGLFLEAFGLDPVPAADSSEKGTKSVGKP